MESSPAIIQAVNKCLDKGRSNGDRKEGMATGSVRARFLEIIIHGSYGKNKSPESACECGLQTRAKSELFVTSWQ